jgi:hypothetical protein
VILSKNDEIYFLFYGDKSMPYWDTAKLLPDPGCGISCCRQYYFVERPVKVIGCFSTFSGKGKFYEQYAKIISIFTLSFLTKAAL